MLSYIPQNLYPDQSHKNLSLEWELFLFKETSQSHEFHRIFCSEYYNPGFLTKWLCRLIKTNITGQLNSEWIYEVIVSPKMPAKNYKDFCLTEQIRIIAKETAYNDQKITKISALASKERSNQKLY